MTHTRTEVLAHAKRLMRFPNPIACSAFLELELMAEGDYLDDGFGGSIRRTYYPGKSDSYFQEVVTEVRRLHTLSIGGL